MKNIKFYILIFLLTINLSVKSQNTPTILPVIPQPNKMEVFSEHFNLNSSTNLLAYDEDQKKVASWFNVELQKQFGLACVIAENPAGKNQIVLEADKNLAKEAYTLKVQENEIKITASSEAGYFYAVQTLLQLAPVVPGCSVTKNLKITAVEIEDKPRFQWRGVMLDISRHFFGPESIKQLIDQMAALKMNRLHLHLSDNEGWRIEIKEYPKLHEIGGKGDYSNPDGPVMYLSEAEARDLTAYAKTRQIIIIPEIDMPGHSGAIGRAYPEFSGDENTINVASPEATKMVETVIHRLTDIFDTPYFHFGSDEVWGKSWEKRADTQARMKELGFTSQKELEAWFDRKIADYIHDSGFIPVAWDEAAELGVNKNTIVQWWRGLEPEVLAEALHQGSKVVLSPVDYIYLDYPVHIDEAGGYWEGLHNGPNTMEAIYHWNPIPEGIDVTKRENILGMEAAVWTEFISNQKRFEYIAYPRLLAVSEKAWTNDENISWNVFQKKLKIQFERYDNIGINYRIRTMGILKRRELQPEAFEGPIPREKSKFVK